LLLQTGASVTLVARRQEKLDGAHKTFDTRDNVRTFQCDLTIKEDIDRLIRYIIDDQGLTFSLKILRSMKSAFQNHPV
jgi:short-subunit dehydrogenase